MQTHWTRAILVSLIMILSSLAGCLDSDEEISTPTDSGNNDNTDTGNNTSGGIVEVMPFGSVMVSTYHVGELVSAVAGDHVTIEYMSQNNIPVHDYEPSVADLVRLQNSDVFFYHGLNLEPWVESTLSSLGDDAPPSYMTHAMPSGTTTLDYESLLVSNLCELMNDGPFESTTLGMMPEDSHDDHNTTDDHDDHNTTDDHDDHNTTDDHNATDDHGDDDHDGHGEDDHDDHDDHEGHEHAEAEKLIENPDACPADTNIQVFHMEAGEHVIEFESEHNEDFNMAALKMLGGHANHDHHGHGSGPFEWAGVFELNDATHTWSMQKVGGDYADPTMRLVLIPTDAPTEESMHSLEAGVEALIEGDSCTVVEDGETMTSIDTTGSCFELHVGTGDDSTFTIDSTGITGMAMYAQHVPTEFERDQHYLKDSAGTDIEPIAQEGAGAHDDHDDHGDDDHGDEMCHNTETHENYESNEEDCEAAGHEWSEDEGHSEEVCHNTETHENYESTEEDCESAGHNWLEHEGHNLPEIHAERVSHTLSFPEDDHDDHDDEDHGDDNHSEEEGHHEVGAVVIHIEVEGDYGFALPNDVELFVLKGEGGHDDHDDHSDDHSDEEGDHDDHSDEEDDHDDHSDNSNDSTIISEDASFTYDPHSWLDPVAFEAQLNIVLEKLILNFPDGASDFTANAISYGVQLQALDDDFENAFGVEGTCTVGGHDKTIVANHNAYSYMSVRYDIDIITLHGLDPEGEPSPQDIIKVTEAINEKGITILFVEEYTNQNAVNSIVEDTGVSIELLYTMEMFPIDTTDNYMTMMNKNLNNIINGIGC